MIKIVIQNQSLYVPRFNLVDEWNTLVAENLAWSDAIKIRDLWNAPHAVKTPVPSSSEAEKAIENRIEQTVGQWPSATGLHWTFDLAWLYPDYTVSKRLMAIKGVVLEFAQPPKLYVERRENPADRRKTQLQQAARLDAYFGDGDIFSNYWLAIYNGKMLTIGCQVFDTKETTRIRRWALKK